jgi:mono/diheme cytochrome c family protein
MKHASLLLAAAAFTAVAVPQAAAVDYKSQNAPIFRSKCFECHSETKKVKGDLALDEAKMSESIGAGKHIVPNNIKQSTLYYACSCADDDEDVMPPKGKNRLSAAELKLLEAWILEGASLTAGGAAPAPAPAAAGTAALQKWTSNDGKVIEASFERIEGESVVLTIPGSGSFLVPLSRLSPESQAQAKAAK